MYLPDKYKLKDRTSYLRYIARCGHTIKFQIPHDSNVKWDMSFPCPVCDPPGTITLDGKPLPDDWYSVE